MFFGVGGHNLTSTLIFVLNICKHYVCPSINIIRYNFWMAAIDLGKKNGYILKTIDPKMLVQLSIPT